jgi:hypothetical protein
MPIRRRPGCHAEYQQDVLVGPLMSLGLSNLSDALHHPDQWAMDIWSVYRRRAVCNVLPA